MQNVSFRDIDEFFEFLPHDELEITRVLRQMILDCIPGVREKLSYNVPFYKKHSNICFIWPASVLWGKKKTYEGVRLGFTKGYMMADDLKILDRGERKQVYWQDFTSLKDIDPAVVKAYLFEAAKLDEATKKK